MKKKLSPRSMFAKCSALLSLMAVMPLSAWAQSVTTVTTTENLISNSTVYAGEVVVDGVSEIKYLYSGEITIQSVVIQNLLDGLKGLEDDDYASLLEGHVFDYDASSPAHGLALCSNPELVAAMDENWSSAKYVGVQYFPDKSVNSETNSNLYDIDEGFKAALDALYEERTTDIDQPLDPGNFILSHLDSRTVTNVYYTVENGVRIRHSDITVIYDSEATMVVYSKVELETLMTAIPLTFEAVEAGTITLNNSDNRNFEYKLNDAEWTSTLNDKTIEIEVEANDVVQFRGNNATLADDDGDEYGTSFTCTGNCYVYGNVMSLLSPTDFATATEVADFCFWRLFASPDLAPNNTILNHPTYDIVLPATTISVSSYAFMFYGCQGITRAPELPATKLADCCYEEMFSSCTNLTYVPDLPAADLTDIWSSYVCMFANCTSLTTAPALPATLLGPGCYQATFLNCSSLVNAPELPASTMVERCYSSMFSGCTSLETAPFLSATTLAKFCYMYMFKECSSLNSVTCLATDISAEDCTSSWLTGVAATGTFMKASDMNDWTVGPDENNNVNGIPYGWTVQDAFVLADSENNDDKLESSVGNTVNVELVGRTLYKDGSWNTLCLPFDVALSGSVLDGDNVDVRTLSSSYFEDGTLTLNFTAQGTITTLKAGKPYIIRWDETGDDLINPLFENVTIGSDKIIITTDYIDFIGTYSPTDIYEDGDKTYLYLGDANALYYPTTPNFTINSFRAYFQLTNELTAGEPSAPSSIRAFVLNFDGSEQTGIEEIETEKLPNSKYDGAWYSLDGMRLDSKPSARGIYINNGRRIVIK